MTINVYIAVDGTNYYLFLSHTTTGPSSMPVVRIHAIQLLPGMGIKVTVNQVSGTPRSYPYYFAAQILSS
ncbi:MAG: hypothetical protein ACP5MH_11195 [Thermoproteus sp.]